MPHVSRNSSPSIMGCDTRGPLLVGFMRELGWRRYIPRSDDEFSNCALVNVVMDAMPEVDMIPRESLVVITLRMESAVKEVKRQVGVSKSTFEEKIQQHVPPDNRIPRHRANCLTRYRLREDGRKAEQRRTGKWWLKPALEFGEIIYSLQVPSPKSRDLFQPRRIEGRYVGHLARAGWRNAGAL